MRSVVAGELAGGVVKVGRKVPMYDVCNRGFFYSRSVAAPGGPRAWIPSFSAECPFLVRGTRN